MANAILACTRKLNHALVTRAALNGLVIKDEELIQIDLMDNSDIADEIKHSICPYVLTSSYAVEGLIALIKKYRIDINDISVFSIRGKTSGMLTDAGVKILGVANDSLGLVEVIRKSEYKKLLHLTSNIRLDAWKEQLREHGIGVENVEVYTKTVRPKPFGKIDGIIFFSPSQVDAFLQQNEFVDDTPVFCIGNTTAQKAVTIGYNNVHIAKKSSEEAVMELVFEHFKIK